MSTAQYVSRVAVAPFLSLLLHIVWRMDPDLAALYQFGLAGFLIPAWLCWVTGSYMLSGPRLRMVAGVVPPMVSYMCVFIYYWNWGIVTGRLRDVSGGALMLFGVAMLASGLIAAAGTLIALIAKLVSDSRRAARRAQ